MSGESDLVHACPFCGQGGLIEAVILATPRLSAIVCQECDTVWLSPKLVGFEDDGRVDEVLPALGIPPDWNYIEWKIFGIPWDRVAPAYQRIIERDRAEYLMRACSPNDESD